METPPFIASGPWPKRLVLLTRSLMVPGASRENRETGARIASCETMCNSGAAPANCERRAPPSCHCFRKREREGGEAR